MNTRGKMTSAALPAIPDLSHIEESLTRFSGTDKAFPVSRWAQELEENAVIFGLTPLQQLILARRSLVSSAALWLRSEKPFASYDDLKEALSREFPDSTSSKDIHELMARRKKHRNESCYDYMLEMRTIANRGGLADHVAIQYIVEGIVDIEANKIMLYGINTYSELKEKLSHYETYKMRSRRNTVVNTKQEVHNNDIVGKSERSVRCFSCGVEGHTSVRCPTREKGRKCFKCNDYGHISSECINNRQEGMQRMPSDPRCANVNQKPLQFGSTRQADRSEVGARWRSGEQQELRADRCQRRSMFTEFTEQDSGANVTSETTNGGGLSDVSVMSDVIVVNVNNENGTNQPEDEFVDNGGVFSADLMTDEVCHTSGLRELQDGAHDMEWTKQSLCLPGDMVDCVDDSKDDGRQFNELVVKDDDYDRLVLKDDDQNNNFVFEGDGFMDQPARRVRVRRRRLTEEQMGIRMKDGTVRGRYLDGDFTCRVKMKDRILRMCVDYGLMKRWTGNGVIIDDG